MTTPTFDPGRTALVLVDLQNDFIHPDGAYARGGATSAAIAALPERLTPLARAARSSGVPIISTHFTLVSGRGGVPLIAEHLRALRPFLRAGDFAPGSWGHGLVDELNPADASIEKVAYSAFLHTRLEWLLRKLGVDHLVVAGIVTNGGVASTVRDAHAREFQTTVLADGCAAFSDDAHRTALDDLSRLSHVAHVADMTAAMHSVGHALGNASGTSSA